MAHLRTFLRQKERRKEIMPKPEAAIRKELTGNLDEFDDIWRGYYH